MGVKEGCRRLGACVRGGRLCDEGGRLSIGMVEQRQRAWEEGEREAASGMNSSME